MRTLHGRLVPVIAAGLLAAGTVSAAAQSDAPEHLALVGVTQIGNRSEAWVVNLRTGGKATLRPGDSAFGYRLQRVGPEQATLTRGDQRFVLRLGEQQLPVQQVAGSRTELRSEPDAPTVTIQEATPASRAPVQRVVTEVVVPEAARPRDELLPNSTAIDAVPPVMVTDPAWLGYPGLRSPFAGAMLPYTGAPGYAAYPEWAAGYPGPPIGYGSLGAPYLGAPLTELDRPSEFPFFPGRGWNPQTIRRRAGDFVRGVPSANPQTLRRRMRQNTWMPYPDVPYAWPGAYQFSPYTR